MAVLNGAEIIARIAPDTRCVYIVGKSGNSFGIPNSAFSSVSERDQFLRLANEWWEDAAQPDT
jgi:hypothetical protein